MIIIGSKSLMVERGGPLASVLALAIGWSLAVGCGGGHALPVDPSSGGAGGTDSGGAGTSGASGAGAMGSAGATASAAGTTSGTAGTTSGAAGATSGAAGAASGAAGATSGAAGATSGAAGSAAGGDAAGAGGIAGSGGAGGAGGASACTGPCPSLACEAGSEPTLDPSIPCCPVCKSVKCASTFTCTPLSCLPGTHAEVSPGQCCASCVANAGSCDQARADYMALEATFREQFGGPCHSDRECTFAVENNGCVSSCFIPLTIAGASMFDGALRTSARICDTVCGIPRPISCSDVPVVCTQGRCAPKP